MTAPKGAKRANTRRQLVEAAAALIAERGYEATTLEEVAARVGMSRGAIYGNFKNRDELFLAVLDAYFKPLDPPFRAGGTLKEQMRIVGEAVVAVIRAPKARPTLVAELQLYAQTHEDMRVRLARVIAEAVRQHAKKWMQFLPEDELPMPPEQFIVVVDALIDGLLLQHFVTPDLVTDEVIVRAFEALA
jgi:AcrR family transcriptional regulator